MRKMFSTKRIYLDYAAATPLDPRILKKMQPYWSEHFGNPGALHSEGRFAKQVITEARHDIAEALLVRPDEIIFTASGTEGNSLALLGYMHALKKKNELAGAHMIVSSAEHPSVRDCFSFFEGEGVSVDFVDFNERGLIDPEALRALLRKETRLVSIAYVNNEIGTVQPIGLIADEIRAHEKETGASVVFHTDASQAPLYFDCTPQHLGVDLMTIDGQKMYGPKGVGFLYKKNSVALLPVMKGGSQEYGLRPGTENVPLIVGIKEAFLNSVKNRESESRKIQALQDHFITALLREIPRVVLNGDRNKRSPSNVNISIPGMDNEYLVVALDERGIAVATKSACLGVGRHSYVVESLTKGTEADRVKGQDRAKSAIRFSLGRGTTTCDLDFVVSVLKDEVVKFDKLLL